MPEKNPRGWRRTLADDVGCYCRNQRQPHDVYQCCPRANELEGIDFNFIVPAPHLRSRLTENSWEYPGHQGIGCDVVSPDDSANFLLLLRELRKKEPTLELTAAVFTPFTGSDKKPMTDVSEFAKVLDPMYWIELVRHCLRNAVTSNRKC